MKDKKYDILLYVFLILISAIVALYTQLPAFKSPYVINDDVRQHTYWMGQFHDKELFNNDIFVQYSSYLSPFGFQLLYYFFTFFLNPILIGKILSVGLYIISGVLLFKLGDVLQDRYAGIILFLLFICFPAHIERFSGGLQRAFAFPLLILFLYYLARFDIKKCVFALILQILFYPPIFLVCYLALFLVLALSITEAKKLFYNKSSLFIVLLPLITLFAILLIKFFIKPAFLGALVTKMDIYGNPSFYKGGRSPFLPLENMGSVVRNKLFYYHKFFAFSTPAFSLFLLYDIFKKRFAAFNKYKIIFALFISSVTFYHLATVFLFKLYLPERYVFFTFPLICMLIISIGISFLPMMIKTKLIKVSFLIIFVLISWRAYGAPIAKKIGFVNETKNVSLYKFLATLPKNTLIAANPFLSDNISCFSQRKVFIKMELAESWFKGYAKIIEKRTLDFFKVYYSNSGEQIYKICKANGIEFMVVSLEDFSREYLYKKNFYFKPLNEKILQFVDKKFFFLPNLNKDKILFWTKDGQFFVIKTDADTLLKLEKSYIEDAR